ncbi:MAG: AbrB/MazE/SpoVT family DNA-binding domain-containing protein [Christensenellaceae bacterium]|nr:AbrB/MazE/SpoVT family DNA-binding domain-containing protein [Christensenellaceae bacterium]
MVNEVNEQNKSEIGDVRRIDALGRLVIPKKLRIEEGINEYSNIEFLPSECSGAIIIKKYDPLVQNEDFIKSVIKTLADAIESSVVISSDGGILFASGKIADAEAEQILSEKRDAMKESFAESDGAHLYTVPLLTAKRDCLGALTIISKVKIDKERALTAAVTAQIIADDTWD